MQVNNVEAAMKQASDYLNEYAATTKSARKSAKVDMREFVTYWSMLKSSGRGVSHDRKCLAKMQKDMAGKTLTKGAQDLYDEVVDYGGSRVLYHTPPRYNSGVGV